MTVESWVEYCAERGQRGSCLERLVIEAPLDPPPNLVSLLTPYVDYVEIREDVVEEEDIWDIEFGSIKMRVYSPHSVFIEEVLE